MNRHGPCRPSHPGMPACVLNDFKCHLPASDIRKKELLAHLNVLTVNHSWRPHQVFPAVISLSSEAVCPLPVLVMSWFLSSCPARSGEHFSVMLDASVASSSPIILPLKDPCRKQETLQSERTV